MRNLRVFFKTKIDDSRFQGDNLSLYLSKLCIQGHEWVNRIN